MHLNILNSTQNKQLALLKLFKREFILVGGTAIALQIGHRRSIDFDLFKYTPVNKQKIKQKLSDNKIRYQILFEDIDGIHLMIDGVKWTFFHYPFLINDNLIKEQDFNTPDLLTLAAMKAYALGRRSKWKDYVDLYVLLDNYFSITQISEQAVRLFGDGFSEKMFRLQLTYFKDIDYSEKVEWMITPVKESTIQKRLIQIALQP